MKTLHINLLFGALTVGLLNGCAGESSSSEGGRGRDRPTVYVVNYPLAYFAERISAGTVDVVFPEVDGDPAYWEPDPDQVGAFQQSDLILLNGAGYAKWVSRVSLPFAKVVDTGKSAADRFISLQDVVTHSHGPEGEHAHGDLAYTIWLDPQLAVDQSRAIKEAFSRAWPDQDDVFEEGFAGLRDDLETLDEDLEALTAGQSDVPLVMSHPVYQYLERRYRLKARSVHWEPDATPDDDMVAELEGILQGHPAKWIIWEGEPTRATVELLRALGLNSVVFDPAGNRPEQGDYLSVMRQNVEQLRRVFAGGGA